MDKQSISEYFLGANSPEGFYSLYGEFTDPSADHLYILKGGPGCGKSTFMKRVGRAASEAGYSVEYIRCSGDPDSLDGVYIPSLRKAYVDGTSPHVIEPLFAGSQASYVNMGAFYDLAELDRRREEIEALTRGYKACYRRAFRLLSAAASLSGPVKLPEEALLTAAKRARGIIRREIKGHGEGRSVSRFLSAYTCKGQMALWDTVAELADKVYLLDNELGLAAIIMEAAASEAESRGWGVVRCRSPLFPERTEHIIVPGLGLALVSRSAALPYPYEPHRHLRLDAIPDKDTIAAVKPELRRRARLREGVISEATVALAEAKELHDRLEAQYIPTVDFDGIDRLTQRHIEAL